MQIIGILGGTFNPIHFGHLRMAQELTNALGFNEVRFIPSANPPHKITPTVSAEHRAQMVQLAIEDNALFTLDRRELRRIGASYTIDTLQSIRSEIGSDASLCLMMGNDAFTKLNTWHHWQHLLDFCHIVLVKRPSSASNSLAGTGSLSNAQPPLHKELELLLHNHYTENADDLKFQQAGYIHMQSITALDISSTAIRASFEHKQLPRYLMPQLVIDYITINQLYI